MSAPVGIPSLCSSSTTKTTHRGFQGSHLLCPGHRGERESSVQAKLPAGALPAQPGTVCVSVWSWAQIHLSVARIPLLYQKWHRLLDRVFGKADAKTHMEWEVAPKLSRAPQKDRLFTFLPPDCITRSGLWAKSRDGQNQKSDSRCLHRRSQGS